MVEEVRYAVRCAASDACTQKDLSWQIQTTRQKVSGASFTSGYPTSSCLMLHHSCSTVGCFVVWQIQEASMGSHFAPALCGLVAAFRISRILFPPSLSRHWYATKTSRQQQICWTIVSFYFFQAGDNYRRGICSPDLISTYTSWRSWWLWNSWMPDIYKSAKHHSTLTIRSCVFFYFIPWRSSQPNHHLGECFLTLVLSASDKQI